MATLVAEALGQWCTIYPHTRIFVPERPYAHSIPYGHICLPVDESDRMLAVMSKPDSGGMRSCVGYCMLV